MKDIALAPPMLLFLGMSARAEESHSLRGMEGNPHRRLRSLKRTDGYAL